MDAPIIYTIGHSTRSLKELTDLLGRAGARELVDVRSVPRSRRHPQFAREALACELPRCAIDYRHESALGGFRRPGPDSPNGAWEHPAFRGYADHMNSGEFRNALDRLQASAKEHPSCVMCAEAQWWRCHRRLISDALFIRGWCVKHLGLHGDPISHELTPFAVVGPGYALTYPPLQGELMPSVTPASKS